MYRTCVCLITLLLGITNAAGPAYLPRHRALIPQSGAYYYNVPSASTMAALRRIIQGHLQRFQQADRQRAQLLQGKLDLQPSRQLAAAAATQRSVDNIVPPNTPTPKNYAMNFLPEGRDVAPGTSYIPLKLLRIRR